MPTPHPSSPSPRGAPVGPLDVDDIVAARELFWHNVMREILTSLSVACLSRGSVQRLADGSPAQPTEADALFDGRLAVLTRGGERIPIADVFPLFACGINTGDAARALSVAVECTVFQIRTPDGHVFTLPLHEMRAFHALSPELMRQLEDLARQAGEGTDEDRLKRPFGFAAFTSTPKGRPVPDPYYAPPPKPGAA